MPEEAFAFTVPLLAYIVYERCAVKSDDGKKLRLERSSKEEETTGIVKERGEKRRRRRRYTSGRKRRRGTRRQRTSALVFELAVQWDLE